MKVLFAGGNGYYPEFSGGVQSSTHDLVRQLRAQGHEATVLAALFGDGLFGFRARVKIKLSGQGAAIDREPGYPVVRAWKPASAAGFIARRIKPDVAVVQCHQSAPIAASLQAHGIPVVIYLRNVEFSELGGDLRELGPAQYIANSEFTARAYRREYSIAPVVIPPTIRSEDYATPSTGEFATLINPYQEKGFDLALELAERCPEIPFLFVESWKLAPEHRGQIESRIRPLKNIRLESRTADMKTVYGRTRVLLAPSKWEEAWGRVASEAHCSGIPVLGSSRGGLPEAVGPGGVVLDYGDADAWATALKRLWRDEQHYSALSNAARTFSTRPELDPANQFSRFMDVLDRAIKPEPPKATVARSFAAAG